MTEWSYIANNETIRTWRKIFGIGFDMLFYELYKTTVNKVSFVGFRGAIAPIGPLNPPLELSTFVCFNLV